MLADAHYRAACTSAWAGPRRVLSHGGRFGVGNASASPIARFNRRRRRHRLLDDSRHQCKVTNIYTASSDVSWEIDVWGKLRRAAENATKT